jgi:hypothetical protein
MGEGGRIMTVNDLIEMLTKLQSRGYGETKVVWIKNNLANEWHDANIWDDADRVVSCTLVEDLHNGDTEVVLS